MKTFCTISDLSTQFLDWSDKKLHLVLFIVLSMSLFQFKMSKLSHSFVSIHLFFQALFLSPAPLNISLSAFNMSHSACLCLYPFLSLFKLMYLSSCVSILRPVAVIIIWLEFVCLRDWLIDCGSISTPLVFSFQFFLVAKPLPPPLLVAGPLKNIVIFLRLPWVKQSCQCMLCRIFGLNAFLEGKQRNK